MSLDSQSPSPRSEPAPTAGTPRHLALLHSVRRRQKNAFLFEALVWATAALAVCLAVAGMVAKPHPMWARWAITLGGVSFVAIFFFAGWRRAQRALVNDLQAAHWLSRRLPGMNHDWVAAVELQQALQERPEFSTALATAFLQDFNTQLAQVNVDSLVDRRPVKRARWAMLGTAIAAGVMAYAAGPRWLEGISTLRAGPQAKTEAKVREPITGDVTLNYRYPAYTGLEPRSVSGTSGEISAPAGTEVVFQTRADRDVDSAALELNGKRVALSLTGNRDLSGRFMLDKPGQYHVVFLDGSRTVAEGPDLPVHIEVDGIPQVRLTAPEEELELDPDRKDVSLHYEVSDDFGIKDVELVYQLQSGPEQRTKLSRQDGKTFGGQYAWDIGALKLKPGQVVRYYVEALDNNEVAGPQKGVSRTQTLKVYSAAEHRREALKRAEEIWDRLVTHLADRMEGSDRSPTINDEIAKRGLPTDVLGSTLSVDTLNLAQEVYDDKDPPLELYAALVNVGDQLKKDVRTTSDVRQWFLKFKKTDFGTRLPQMVAREIEHTEKSVLYLESMLDREKLSALKQLSKQLKEDQRELAKLLEEFKRTKDADTQKALLDQMQGLRERMAELMQRMAEVSKGIHDEHFNQEAMEEMMADRDLSKSLNDVEKLVREGKADEAMAKMQALSMELDQMLESLNDAAQEAEANDNPELAQKFEAFSKELEETTQAQETLAQETKQLKDRYRQALRDRIAQRGNDLKNELLRKTADLKKSYQTVDPDQLGFRAGEPHDALQRELENIEGALKSNDFDMAAEAAAQSDDSAADLAAYGEEQRRRSEQLNLPPADRKEARDRAEQLKRDARKTHELAQQLQNLFPQAGEMLSAEDQKSLKQQGVKQRQLEQRANKLKSQMDELSQMAPVFDDESRHAMEEAGRRMGEASRKLQGQDARGGAGEQQAALEKLKELGKQMEQSQSGRGGSGNMPLPMMAGERRGPGGKPKKVDIPDEDPNRAPRELRKDVLDAMKQGAPDRYKEQLKRYYEELVQ